MNLNDAANLGCAGLPAGQRCDATLPDNPQCAPNYHFGMLLGVDDFRAEQGFHVGRQRRHQRALHGKGVVAGYPVQFDATRFDLRVGPGYGIDALGRDLALFTTQCVNLPLWWQKHQGDEAFDDIADPDHALFDLDVVACYATCLDRPVPAIAEPCAGDAADIAHARVCEIVTLSLQRHQPPAAPATAALPDDSPYHLLRMWLGLDAAALLDDGSGLKEDDQWLANQFAALTALPADQQADARAALLRELTARAVAATDPLPPEPQTTGPGPCLTLARLHGVQLTRDANGWRAEVERVELGVRTPLLPTGLLQAVLMTEPPPVPAPAGPVIAHEGASVSGTELTLKFSQALAAASVAEAAFAVSEFDTTAGWAAFTLSDAQYDDTEPAAPLVRLTLDRAPAGSRLRITVVGTGNAPLLGANLVPAGAAHPDGDGRNLTFTLII